MFAMGGVRGEVFKGEGRGIIKGWGIKQRGLHVGKTP